MKTLEFIYQDTQIHFALQNKGNVMVNATEMAKMFNRRTEDYLKTKSTKAFISALENNAILPLNGGRIIEYRGRNGIYFERKLALDFAAWLDVDFRIWVFSTIDKILFGHYKQHWNAHLEQTKAEATMKNLKQQMLINPTTTMVQEYFEAERQLKNAKNTKLKAMKSQYKIKL